VNPPHTLATDALERTRLPLERRLAVKPADANLPCTLHATLAIHVMLSVPIGRLRMGRAAWREGSGRFSEIQRSAVVGAP